MDTRTFTDAESDEVQSYLNEAEEEEMYQKHRQYICLGPYPVRESKESTEVANMSLSKAAMH